MSSNLCHRHKQISHRDRPSNVAKQSKSKCRAVTKQNNIITVNYNTTIL